MARKMQVIQFKISSILRSIEFVEKFPNEIKNKKKIYMLLDIVRHTSRHNKRITHSICN